MSSILTLTACGLVQQTPLPSLLAAGQLLVRLFAVLCQHGASMMHPAARIVLY